MIVKNGEETEIWTDGLKKGEAKKCFITMIVYFIILSLCFISIHLDFSIKETYYFLIAFIGMPCFLLLLAGTILSFKEKQPPKILLKINKEYIEIYGKKNIKIELNKIKKVNIISTSIDNFPLFYAEIIYTEGEAEKKHRLEISPANRGLIENVIKEYNRDIIVENIVKKKQHNMIF